MLNINKNLYKRKKAFPYFYEKAFQKMAATYSPTITQYHRRDKA